MTHRYYTYIRTYVRQHRDVLTTAAIVAGIGIVLCGAIALLIRSSMPNVVYQPVGACELLTRDKARQQLGDAVMLTTHTTPTISGDLAVSKCGYTDGTADMERMLVAAVIVRAGINDAGVAQNKSEFAAGKPKQGAVDIKGVGDAAYFDTAKGQLNVLDSHNWLILSYGVGATPEKNTQKDAVQLAHSIVSRSDAKLPHY